MEFKTTPETIEAFQGANKCSCGHSCHTAAGHESQVIEAIFPLIEAVVRENVATDIEKRAYNIDEYYRSRDDVRWNSAIELCARVTRQTRHPVQLQ